MVLDERSELTKSADASARSSQHPAEILFNALKT
jgi:hypothetical protein